MRNAMGQGVYVILPALLPNVMVALRLSLAAACSIVIGAELIAAQEGLDFLSAVGDHRCSLQLRSVCARTQALSLAR